MNLPSGEATKPSGWMQSAVRWAPGLIISAVAVALLLRVVDLNLLAKAWQQANLLYLVPGGTLLLLAMVARGGAWHVLSGRLSRPARAFWVLNVGYLVNAILPLRLGDLARALLAGSPRAGETSTLTASGALSSVVLERVLDLVCTFGLVMLALPVVAGQAWGGRTIVWTTGVAVIGVAGVLVAGLLRGPLVRWLGARAPAGSPAARWVARIEQFLRGLEALRDWRIALPAMLLLILTWFIWLLEYTVMLRAFVPQATLADGLIALVGSALGMMIPSSPGGIGVYEAAVVGALAVIGIESERALAYAITVHVLNSAGVIGLGLIGLLREGQTLEQLVRNVLKVSTGRGANDAPSA
jgi:uncharacterized membrane protein YbhN (UPF0104 family)